MSKYGVCGACGGPLSDDHNRSCIAWQAGQMGWKGQVALGAFVIAGLVTVFVYVWFRYNP